MNESGPFIAFNRDRPITPDEGTHPDHPIAGTRIASVASRVAPSKHVLPRSVLQFVEAADWAVLHDTFFLIAF